MNTIVTHSAMASSHFFEFPPEVLESIGAGSRDRTGILSLEDFRAFHQPTDLIQVSDAVPCMFTHREIKSMIGRRHSFSSKTRCPK